MFTAFCCSFQGDDEERNVGGGGGGGAGFGELQLFTCAFGDIEWSEIPADGIPVDISLRF